ncbi:MAG: shikimate kinase [Candidatus Caenarcaniphilales bacterium]|nr:shikimate kinase [Candidatus Caenarcaniphilales bacterium]
MNDSFYQASTKKLNIILLGMMGSGKSTVGQFLSQRLFWQFMDADSEIEKFLNKTIQEIFSNEGENFFREQETAFLLNLKERNPQKIILSTGGGMVLKPESRLLLKQLGFNVWLKAFPETIHARLEQNYDRPLLRLGEESISFKDKINTILSQRENLYAQMADLVVEVDELSPDKIAERIINHFEEKTTKNI